MLAKSTSHRSLDLLSGVYLSHSSTELWLTIRLFRCKDFVGAHSLRDDLEVPLWTNQPLVVQLWIQDSKPAGPSTLNLYDLILGCQIYLINHIQCQHSQVIHNLQVFNK